MKKENRLIIVVICITISALAFCLLIYSLGRPYVVKSILYYDEQDLYDSFPIIKGIQSCIWMNGALKSNMPGPSTFWTKALIKIDETFCNELTKNYSWEKADPPEIPVEFSTWIDTYGECIWHKSYLFENDMDDGRYIGSYFFDMDNQILYIDASLN